MSNIPNLIDHASFSFDNLSNYDINRREITGDSVVDVPVFPPQNIVIDNQAVQIYGSLSNSDGTNVNFVYNNEVYSILLVDHEQRMVFLKYNEYDRNLVYRYGGRIYPQAREEGAYALTHDSLYVFGGKDLRIGRRELWRLDLAELQWYPLHDVGDDADLRDFPAQRWSSCFISYEGDHYVMGGQTYSEIGNIDIELNDLWWYSKASDEWKKLDKESYLPREGDAKIVYFDGASVQVVSDGKLWNCPKDGSAPTAQVYNGMTLGEPDYTAYIDGAIHYMVSGVLYKWNTGLSDFESVKTQIEGIGIASDSTLHKYITSETVERRRGQDSQYQPIIEINIKRIHHAVDDTLDKICDIDAVPVGQYMASTDLPDGKKFLGLGINNGVFNEDYAIWDGFSMNTIMVGSSDPFKPQERLAPSCCYDSTRNGIWLFGGYAGSFYYNDLWFLDLETDQWTRISERVSETEDENGTKLWPKARARTGMCIVDDTLWIVAGYSDVMAYADMWKYDVEAKTMTEEIQTDWVPFGTNYDLFEWRDRMWLFNGEKGKLYRYYYEFGQWYPVQIYNTRALTQAAEALKQLAYSIEQSYLQEEYEKSGQKIGSWRYASWRAGQCDISGYNEELRAALDLINFMLPPIRLSIQGNNLLITYKHLKKGKKGSVTETFMCSMIDMDAKEHISLPGAIGNAKFWRDRTCSIDDDGFMYFYNVSTFEYAQRNQVPYFEYSYFPLADECPLTKTNSTFEFMDPDIVGGNRSRLAYIDSENLYIIYDDDVEFSPLMPTVSEMEEGLWAEYWPQRDFSVFGYWPSGDDTSAQDDAKAIVGNGRYRTVPRFLWKRLPPSLTMEMRNSMMTWYDERTDRTFIVDGASGSIKRFRIKDGTSMVYPSKLWRESAVARKGTVVYSFGGSLIGGGPISDQVGIANSGYKMPVGDCAIFVPDSHNSFMLYDLSYVGFQMKLLKEHPDLEPYDYDNIRDFLIDVAVTNGITTSSTEPNDMVEDIANTLYSSTVSIAGDLAVRHLRNENGIRPPHPRSGAISVQINGSLYVGGGAWKYYIARLDPEYCLAIVSCETYYKTKYDQDPDVIDHEYNDFYRFDIGSRTWIRLADLPICLYGASVVEDHTGENLYVVGGFRQDDLQDASNQIFIYNIADNKWSELGPTPEGYGGRGMPNISWIDPYRMMIMYGFSASPDNTAGKTLRVPKPDCWMVDIQTGMMYKMFESASKTSSVIEQLDEGDGLIDLVDFFYPMVSKLSSDIGLGMNLGTSLNAGMASLLGLPSMSIVEAVPKETAMNTQTADGLKWYKIDPIDGKIVGIRNVKIPESGMEYFSPTNVKALFRAWDGNPWMVLSTDFGPRVYRWYKESAWEYSMDFLPTENPLESHCEVVIWDGISKLICMWNKFNIWEMDLKAAAYNPDSDYWRRLPPNPDLEDIGIVGNEEEIRSDSWGDNEVICYRSDGGVYRYDKDGMLWRVDRLPRREGGGKPFLPTEPSTDDLVELLTSGKGPTPETSTHANWEYTTVVRDDMELYYYTPGTTSGVYYHLLYKQADKFYFDAELLEPVISMPVFEALVGLESVHAMMKEMPGYQDGFGKEMKAGPTEDLGEILAGMGGDDLVGLDVEKMKSYLMRNRSVVKRDRILTFNRNNHLMRAWVKKYGEFDVRLDFDAFFVVTRVDISVDYDTMAQASRFTVEMLNDEGTWVTDTSVQAQLDTGFDWDPFARKYRKQQILPSGEYTYIETTRPEYYIRTTAPADSKIRAVRVRFQPKPEAWNYIARINHIFVVSEEGGLEMRDESGSLSVFYIEPFDTIESDVYKVYVKNVSTTDPVYNPRVFVRNNYRILMSSDMLQWDNHDVDTPMTIAESIEPEESAFFYIKAVSYFDKSNLDLVLTCDKALV